MIILKHKTGLYPGSWRIESEEAGWAKLAPCDMKTRIRFRYVASCILKRDWVDIAGVATLPKGQDKEAMVLDI